MKRIALNILGGLGCLTFVLLAQAHDWLLPITTAFMAGVLVGIAGTIYTLAKRNVLDVTPS